MAKPFYSMEEVCSALKKTPDDIRALVRDGALREFRDAGKVFFKSEDVDRLKGAGGPGDSGEIILEAVDDAPPPVVDKLGASDSIGLAMSEPEPASKDDTAITAGGISVFDDDELEIDADPMAKTRISGAVGDEVPIDGGGSGSGLLDLTREADDTSLGAELLDEIYPGEDEAEAQRKRPAPAEEPAEEEAEPAAEEPIDAGEVIMPVYVPTGDPQEPIFGGVLVGATVVLAVSASVVGAVLQGYYPSYGLTFSNNFLYFILGSVLVLGLSALLGWVVGKAMAPRRA